VTEEVVAVQRGDLSIDITAAGNLVLSRTEELTFEIAGTVEEVLVEEGDTVEEGEVLAKLGASEWEDHLEALEGSLTAAERNLSARGRAVTTAERNLAAKERAVTTRENDLLQAEINLKTAQRALDVMTDVQEAQDAVEEAEYDLQIARARLQEALESTAGGDPSYWLNQISIIQTGLAEARAELAEVLAEPDNSGVTITEVSLKQLQLDLNQKKLAAAEEAVEVAQGDVVEARKDIEDAQVAVADAQEDLDGAREELDEAMATSLEIVAPFDGFITRANVEGGDEVLAGTVAVQLADPEKFEADILVSEMDILPVKLGGEAWVQVDAMSGLTLPAKVTHIAPTATIQQGVVNYKVTVELDLSAPLASVTPSERPEQPETGPEALSRRLDEAVKAGRITQEQAEQFKQRLEQMDEAVKAGRISQEQVEEMRKRFEQGGTGEIRRGMMPETIQLREGLTVTVTVIVEEKNDVLLVPNQAIIRQGNETFVRVSKDGVTTERLIKTGISNWQYTEVTEGLGEGEKVVVTGTVATNSPTTPESGKRMPLFPVPRK